MFRKKNLITPCLYRAILIDSSLNVDKIWVLWDLIYINVSILYRVEMSDLVRIFIWANFIASSTSTPTGEGGQNTPAPNPVVENLRQTMQIAADYLKDYLNPLTEYTSLNLNVMQHLSHITQLYPTILNEKFSDYLLSHLSRWLENISQIFEENSGTNLETFIIFIRVVKSTSRNSKSMDFY